MGIKKQASLKTSFWKFIWLLLIGLSISAGIPFSLIFAGANTGFITYADYLEQSVKKLAPVIAATPDITDVQLPMGCGYLILDENYQVTGTSMEGEDLEQAMAYAVSGKLNGDVNKQYLFITRSREYVVLQYYIGTQFTNEWCYKHLPSPEILLCILIVINCTVVCMVLTAKFAKNLQKQLSPLLEATKQVAQQDLDFEVGHSKIKEFEEVLVSFADMKDNLKLSLEQQWNAEQLQRNQIAALAHDLKTPVTVIQGNIDLISETSLDDTQRLYADYITESTEQISFYIRTLIDISRTDSGYRLCLEVFSIEDYRKQIEMQANALCLAKGLHIHMQTEMVSGCMQADKMLLKRAIMNVLNNAVDYSPENGTIYVAIEEAGEFLQISITDEGEGFTPEAIQHAQDQFFMGDSSRSSNMHFGMGLYITSSIIRQHHGEVILKNSDVTNGAEVIIKIPLKIP